MSSLSRHYHHTRSCDGDEMVCVVVVVVVGGIMLVEVILVSGNNFLVRVGVKNVSKI